MQVIPPIEITDAMFTSSTVQETVAATYSGGTTYALGALVGLAPVLGQAQVIWRSLQNGNTGNALTEGVWWTGAGSVYPAYSGSHNYAIDEYVQDNTNHLIYQSLVMSNNGHPLTDTTKWQLVGPTNKWAMFDYERSTRTSVPLTFTAVFAPGERINAFALAGIRANSYSLTMTSVTGGGTVYSASGSLNTRETLTWYQYFFGDFSTQESLAFFDLPPYTDNILTLTLTATTGNAELGACVIGNYVYIGETQYSAVSDVLNFSSINRDENGTATLVPRRNVPKTSQTIWCDKDRVNRVRQCRDDLNATPAIWYGIDDSSDGWFESLQILGIYKEFTINVALPEKAVITLTLEEI
jgi:hypothetical protein